MSSEISGEVARSDGAAPSPFIPGTNIQFAFDSTSLGWIKECPQKYKLAMIDGWRSKAESVHLRFGILYHSALERFDRLIFDGASHDDALIDVVRWLLEETWIDGKPWDSGHEKKTRETLVRSVIWYAEQFKDDTAKTVRLADGSPAVELSFRMQLTFGIETDAGFQPYILSGHIDRIVTIGDALYVSDRKTASGDVSGGGRFYDQFKPDNQMSIYTLAGQVVFQTPVKGVMIDAAQINIGATNFGRGLTYRTKSELNETVEELRYWFAQARQFAEANYWPHNDKACHRYDGCQFRKVCGHDPAMRERVLESDFVKHPWNPLESR